MTSNKQVQVDYIVSCLEKGETRGRILAKFLKKWQITVRTFDRLLKFGKDEHQAALLKIKARKEKLDLQNALNERQLQIIDVNERKQILSKIIRGDMPLKKPMVVAGKLRYPKIVPDWDNRRSAIAELNKMEGDYAPDKVANVTPDGQPVQTTPLLSDDQFIKLINAINNKTGTGQG